MKNLSWLIVILLAGTKLAAADSVSVPWEEFKKLYRSSIENEIMKKTSRKNSIPIHTIEEAIYQISLDEKKAKGRVLISGRFLSGEPRPIPLFGDGIIISQVESAKGCSLLPGNYDGACIFLLPEGEGPFQIALSFFVPVEEDTQSSFVRLDIPVCLKNSLALEMPDGTRVEEAPGIRDKKGVYYFSASRSMLIRFMSKKDADRPRIIDIDSFSRVRFQGKLAMVTTYLTQSRPVSSPFTLQLPGTARYVSWTLRGTWIEKKDGNTYRITLPPHAPDTFSVQFAVPELEAGGAFELSLPTITDNNGKEGNFVLEEPDDARITPAGKGLVSRIPVTKLHDGLRTYAKTQRTYMRMPHQQPVRLAIKRFDSVKTPATVLDSVFFFTSFEENGGVLSVIRMEVPPGDDTRLNLGRIPGAKVWSLKVNGRKRKVYTEGDGGWIVPLAKGERSCVELAFLRKQEKLGLHGRLETKLPEIGFPARNLYVGIALPERVQLISIEGPITSSPDDHWDPPQEMTGRPHFFSRSFYEGEGMNVVLYYKEPVKRSE